MKLLLSLIRTRPGGIFAGWLIAHFSFVLPFHRLYESDRVLAFHHPSPTYGLHILILPKMRIAGPEALGGQHAALLAEIWQAAQTLARQHAPDAEPRLIANGGAYQDVKLLHFHLISGPEI